MPEQLRVAEPAPYAEITAALARIEAAYPALLFADERATEEAGEGFRRAVRLIKYQLRGALAAPASPPR
jgi:hypothetical protein